MSADMLFNTKPLSDFLFGMTNFLSTSVETNFNPTVTKKWAENNYHLCFTLIICYLIAIFGGSKVMESQKPFNLRLPLALWNAFLSFFSFVGMCRTVPTLLGLIFSTSFEETVCTDPMASWGVGTSGFWVMLFIFSKVPELVDTIFIVLRKKPLIFLHWYHHISVLAFCWNAYATTAGSGLYFVAMNYSVHALMYGYYCLQALNMCPKSFPTVLITISQIAQMFVGTGVCLSTWYFMLSGKSCNNSLSNLTAGAIMYSSYLYLFVEFALKRYGGPKKNKKLD